MQMRIGGACHHDSGYRASEFGRLRKDVVIVVELADWLAETTGTRKT